MVQQRISPRRRVIIRGEVISAEEITIEEELFIDQILGGFLKRVLGLCTPRVTFEWRLRLRQLRGAHNPNYFYAIPPEFIIFHMVHWINHPFYDD